MMARRWSLLAPALFLILATRQAEAAADLVVLCDLPLGAALGTVGAAFRARTGVRIDLFPTAPGLIVPQLAHDVQSDIVVTQLGVLGQAAQAGLLAAGARSGHWRNPLVVAERTGATGAGRVRKICRQ